MKKFFTVLLCLLLFASLLPINVFAGIVVNDPLRAYNIELPMEGAKPDFDATLGALSSTYYIDHLEWVEYDDGWEWQKDMTANDTFKKNYWYVVYVYFATYSANDTFGNLAVGYINDNKANTNGGGPSANGTKFSCYYAYQASEKLTRVPSIDLTVVNPVVGKTPTFAKVENDSYVSGDKQGFQYSQTNGVSWVNEKSNVGLTISNPFKADTTYTLYYTFYVKNGYYFDDNTTATVNGIKAEIDVFSANENTSTKEVAVVYLKGIAPGDGKKVLTSIDLNITAPKDGEKPSFNKIDNTGFYSDNGSVGVSTAIYKNGIAWYKSASSVISAGTTETFKGGATYTLKIMLTAKEGYKFTNATTAKINGKTATIEQYNDGSIQVSVELTALQKDHTHTPGAEWKYDSEGHWKVCSDPACGEIAQAKASHADLNGDNKCDTCSYASPASSVSPPEADTTPQATTPIINPDDKTDVQLPVTSENTENKTDNKTDNEKVPEEQSENDTGISLPVIIGIIAGCVLLGGAAAYLYFFLKKKQGKKQ